jgi:hypothetical protein
MSVPILSLNEMSVEEKLQTMEALWQSLSTDPAGIVASVARERVSQTRTKGRIGRDKVCRLGKSESRDSAAYFVRIEILPA